MRRGGQEAGAVGHGAACQVHGARVCRCILGVGDVEVGLVSITPLQAGWVQAGSRRPQQLQQKGRACGSGRLAAAVWRQTLGLRPPALPPACIGLGGSCRCRAPERARLEEHISRMPHGAPTSKRRTCIPCGLLHALTLRLLHLLGQLQ